MATELIGVKVEVEIKDRILKLIDSGKYQNLSAFLHKAIRTQLERDESGIDPEEALREMQIELERTKNFIDSTLRSHEERILKLESE